MTENSKTASIPQEIAQKIVSPLQQFKNELIELGRSVRDHDSRIIIKITRKAKRWTTIVSEEEVVQVRNTIFSKNENSNLSIEWTEKEKDLIKLTEIDLFIQLIFGIILFRNDEKSKAKAKFEHIITTYEELNNKNLAALNTQAFHFLSLIYEKNKTSIQLRTSLLEAYRSACLRKDQASQAKLINLILRNYIMHKDIEEASIFIESTTFPEKREISEHCRYLYYTGLVQAIGLEYYEASGRLSQALKIAPDSKGLGFKLIVQKLSFVVELLQGNIPERAQFSQSETQSFLKPYYLVVQSVRKGDMKEFNQVCSKYKHNFQIDGLENLIYRLPQNVIRAGLKKIVMSYSKISFADVAKKLNLEQNQNVEYILLKALRDRVIQGRIDLGEQVLYLSEGNDVYSSSEPQTAFSTRISFLNSLTALATKSLHYPFDSQQAHLKREENGEFTTEDILKLLADEFQN